MALSLINIQVYRFLTNVKLRHTTHICNSFLTLPSGISLSTMLPPIQLFLIYICSIVDTYNTHPKTKALLSIYICTIVDTLQQDNSSWACDTSQFIHSNQRRMVSFIRVVRRINTREHFKFGALPWGATHFMREKSHTHQKS